MSLLDAFGKLLRPKGQTVTEVLCPRCEKRLDERHVEKDCIASGETRRMFLGLLGATSVALVARLDGIPIPTARVMVVARSRDLIRVEASGPFSIAFEQAMERDGSKFRADGLVVQDAALMDFKPDQRIRVNEYCGEMRIVGVKDKATGTDLKFRVVRAHDADMEIPEHMAARRTLDGRIAPTSQLSPLHPSRVPQGVEAFLRVPIDGDFVWDIPTKDGYYNGLHMPKHFQPASGGVAQPVYRALKGYEFVYSIDSDCYEIQRFIPANLRALRNKYPKNASVHRAINKHLGRDPYMSPLTGPVRTLPV